MKLMKKMIAAVAALTMTMASAGAAFAAEDGTIEGGAEYINTTVYKLTLPTTAGVKFTLDPQGLLKAGTGSAIDAATNGGEITGSGVMLAYSESSVDVTCSAAFYIEAPTSTAVTAESSIASMPATKQAIGLQIVYEAKNGDKISNVKDASGNSIVTAGDVATTNTLDVTATSVNAASVINEKLTKVPYVTTGNATDGFDYIKADDDDASILLMRVGGKVTTDADWSNYTKNGTDTIKLKTVFTFKNAENVEVSSAKAVYGALVGTTIYIASENDSTNLPKFPEGTQVTNLKANGLDCEFTMSDGWVAVSWDQLVAAGATTSPLTITFDANGQSYSMYTTY